MLEPSEFEEVVEIDPIHDTTMESAQLLTLSNLASEVINKLNGTCHEICARIESWSEISLTTVASAMVEQAEEYTSLKEDYVKRRKSLAAAVKCFLSQFLDDEGGFPNDSLKSECKNIITRFKSEFDQLANMNRFTEEAFMSAFRFVQSIVDPGLFLKDCIEEFDRCREIITLQKDFITKSFAIKNKKNILNDSSLTENMDQYVKLDSLRFREIIQRETSELRAVFEVQMRDREQAIRLNFEKQQLEMQQKFESIISQKDSELTSILGTLNEQNQHFLSIQKNESYLQQETQRRHVLEERIQTLLIELNECKSEVESYRIKFENCTSRLLFLESHNEQLTRAKQESIRAADLESCAFRKRIQDLQQQLLERPPVDLNGLASKIGLVSIVSSDQGDGNGNDEKISTAQPLSWVQVEDSIVTCMRRISAEAAECRVSQSLMTDQCHTMERDLVETRAVLVRREDVVAQLEKDLVSAHSIIEANKALLKCYQSAGGVASAAGNALSVPQHKASKGQEKQLVYSGEELDSSSTRDQSSSTTENMMSGTVSAYQQIRQGNISHTLRGKRISRGGYQNNVPAKEEDDVEHVAGADAEDAQATPAPASNALAHATESSGRMLFLAIQNQRDRFMRLARDREQEALAAKERVGVMLQEKAQLRSDNMELYRRIRSLRLVQSHAHNSNGTRTKKAVHQNTDDIPDDLEGRYQKQYMEQLDPFKLDELDRELALSQLNIIERTVTQTIKLLISDRWTRLALLAYLLVVHVFAAYYVYQVLSPEIASETDMKWALDTSQTSSQFAFSALGVSKEDAEIISR